MGRKGVRQYDLIESDLRGRIESGELAPGARLTENELARLYDVSREPVRKALEGLARSGLVEAKRGRGTFVVDRKPTEVELVPADHPFSVRMPDPDEVRRLGLRKDREPVIEVYHTVRPIEVDLRSTAHKIFHYSACERCSV
jgi:DNA-binding GntR family transcriptional regulator